jgi:integrase
MKKSGGRWTDGLVSSRKEREISFPEEQRILMCCDVRLGLIITVLLYTGMRVGIEALRIKWTDVDFEEAVITVAQSKTAAGLRALPMTAFVASELEKWHASTSGISEYVFFNLQRPSMHIQSVKTAWHNALKLAGIPRFPIYQCRHTFATRLAGLGVSDRIIDQLLGHAPQGVLRFYTARVPEYLRDAINLLEKLRTAKTGHSGDRTDQGASREAPNPNKLARLWCRRLSKSGSTLQFHYNAPRLEQCPVEGEYL